MKREFFIFGLVIIILISLTSCGEFIPTGDNNLYPSAYVDGVITFNIDGSEQFAFGPECDGLDCDWGILTAMNDNKSFMLTNEHLFIFNTKFKTIESYLTNIKIDYTLNGLSRTGLSYDDQYVVFTSDHQLYLLELNDKNITQLTYDEYDMYPQFGVDGQIYFSRYNSEDNSSKLMIIDLDGGNMQEICEASGQITQIFPGLSDLNTVFFMCDQRKFQKINIINQETDLLYEFSNTFSLVTRTNNDGYFNFSGHDVVQYCFNTSSLEMTEYLYPQMEENKYISIIMPDRNEALVYKHLDYAILMLWDPDSNTQTGEDFIVSETSEWGSKTLAISPNGSMVAILHTYNNYNHY